MKIRTQITLSFFLIITLITLAMLGITTSIVDILNTSHLKGTEAAIDRITEANYQMSEKVLTAYGERIVLLKARSVAKELSYLLKGMNLTDYDALRKNRVLRKIATQNIHSWNSSNVGYLDILDRKGVAVLHPNPNVEGKNFAEWKQKYPKMWHLVERSFKDDEIRGNYFFIDRHNKACLKYMVIKQIPGTQFNVCAVVNIDEFFQSVHQDIEKANIDVKHKAEAYINRSSHEIKSELNKMILLAGLAVLVFGLIYGWWFSDFISRPITQLQNALAEMEAGKFTGNLEENGTTETMLLTSAFNQLNRRYQQQREELKANQSDEEEPPK